MVLFLPRVQNLLRKTKRQADGDKNIRFVVKDVELEKCSSHLGTIEHLHLPLESTHKSRRARTHKHPGTELDLGMPFHREEEHV